MTIVELLGQLRDANVQLSLDGDKLKIKAPQGALTDAMKEQLKLRKDEVMAFLRGAKEGGSAPFPRISREGPLPLSYMQQGLWFVEQLTPGTAAYTMPIAFKITGDLSIDALERAVANVVARHETLRTRFSSTAEGQAFAIIDPPGTFCLRRDTVVTEADAIEQAMRAHVSATALSVFDLERGPLFTLAVTEYTNAAGQSLAWLVDGAIHHIVSDGWSQSLLVKEILAQYVIAVTGLALPVPELSVQYVDFAAWQQSYLQSDAYARKLAYWVEHLRGVPAHLALPTDFSRPMVQGSKGANVRFRIEDDTASRFLALCLAREITPFMGLMAAWQIVLARYAQQQDFCVGIPTAGRNHQVLESLIGFFVDPLVIRSTVNPHWTLDEVLSRVRQEMLDAFERQEVPLAQILDRLNVPRNAAYAPLAQVGFQLQNFSGVMSQSDAEKAMLAQIQQMAKLSVDMLQIDDVASKFDMIVTLVQSDGKLSGDIEYNVDLFKGETISLIARQLERVMKAMIESPDELVRDVLLGTLEEVAEALGIPHGCELRPLTDTQRILFLDSIVNPDTVQNGVGFLIDFERAPDAGIIRDSLAHLFTVYSVCRTRFITCELPWADSAWQVVDAKVDPHFEVVDCTHLSDHEFDELYDTWIHPAYEVVDRHLQSFRLFLRASGARLAGRFHHLVFDGMTAVMWYERLRDCYEARLNHQAFPVWPDGFPVYIGQRRAIVDRPATLEFWKQRMADTVPLSFWRVPGAESRRRFDVRTLRLGEQRSAALDAYCDRQGIRAPDLFRLLTRLLVRQYCRPEGDFLVNEMNAGRIDPRDQTLGCFYQVFPCVVRLQELAPALSVADAVRHVSRYRTEVRHHRNVSILALLENVEQGPVNFQFNYMKFGLQSAWPDQSAYLELVSPYVERTCQIILKESSDGHWVQSWTDRSAFDDHGFLERMASIIDQLIEGHVAHLGDIDTRLPHERTVMHSFTGVKPLVEHEESMAFTTIVTWLEHRARVHADAIAVECGQQSLSYAALDASANGLAMVLSQRGVARGHRVAILLGRRIEFLVAVLAVLKTGASYVPVESSYPCERIRHIITDSGAALVISEASLDEKLQNTEISRVDVDQPWQPLAHNRLPAPLPSDEIYVIYTSGSTGLPKGAAVTHAGEINLQRWYLDVLDASQPARALIISAFGFDLTQKNLFAPLLCGGRVVFPSFSDYDDVAIRTAIRERAITLVNCAPSAFYPLVSDPAHWQDLTTLRHVVLGGEPIRLALLNDWLLSEGCSAVVVNSYGPTECTDVVAFHALPRTLPAGAVIPIGRPVPGCDLHLLDDDMRPVPPGLAGELCVSGICVGNGYLNQHDLTDRVFVSVPGIEGRVYRTGDLARVLPDGTIEYLGRKDFQVKLRGLRIELGEIENALCAVDGIDDALVMLRNEALIAYATGSTGIVSQSVLQSLRASLPDYMVPSHLVLLPAWPLTPNGKVDRKALPAPESSGSGDQFVAPRTPLETRLAQIWQDVLKRDSIGIHDNFFALGGHSLLATQIVSRIRKALDVPINLRELLSAPTIEGLAQLIGRHTGKAGDAPLVRIDRHQRIPLSFAQQRLWLLERIELGNVAYNVPVAVHMRGPVKADALAQAFSDVINRHEGLRTCFGEDEQGAFQQLLPIGAWPLQQESLPALVGDTDFAIQRHVVRVMSTQFDLAAGPLFRASLLRVGDRHHVFTFVAHHIVTDGWSMGIFLRELVLAYLSHAQSSPIRLEPLPLQYADFAVWQRQQLDGERQAQKLAFWRDTLADVPVLSLATDRVRPTVQTFNGATLRFTIDADDSRRLSALAGSHSTTRFNLVAALFSALLSRYSGQDDLALGSPVAGRDRVETEGIVGFFVNTVTLRIKPRSELSLLDLLAQVAETTRAAFEHQDIPFEEIVDAVAPIRDMSRSPLFQVMLVEQNIPLDAKGLEGLGSGVGGLEIASVDAPFDMAKYDLTLTVAEQGAELGAALQYNTDLFDASTIQRMIDSLLRLAHQWLRAPSVALGDLDWLPTAERHQLLNGLNATARDFDRNATVQRRVLASVHAHPERIAIRCGDATLTYRELDAASGRLASHLASQGVSARDRVGVCFDRSLHLMSALLAVVRLGATYVPIDASYPVGRIEHMVTSAGIAHVLTRATLTAALPATVRAHDVDAMLAETSAVEIPALAGVADDLFYVIYTSGSTGVPKGAAVYQRSEINLLEWYVRDFGMTPDDRVLLMSAIGFDLTQKNLWAPLTCGATLVIPEFQEYDPVRLAQCCERDAITWVNCAPSAFYPLVEESDPAALSSLRWVFLGGEPINLARLQRWYQKTRTHLVNSYGPTECTDISSFHVVARDHDPATRIPIGRPNDNVQLYVLRDGRELVPMGATGELCVGGDGVGAGYIGDDAQTRKAFIAHPFTEGQRLYRTGDLVRYLDDGAIDYLGRIDQQIKLRGYRIEVSEIQAVIARADDVRDVHVDVITLHGVQRLVAWYVANDASVESAIRELVARHLPVFMQPQSYVCLRQFPLTPNGKIDRKALPSPDTAELVLVPPATELERDISTVWCRVLGHESVGMQQAFFDLGGNSLQATTIVSRLNKQLGTQLSVRSIFDHPVLSDFCAHVETCARSDGRPAITAGSLDGDLPLSHGQSRLWYFEQLNPGTSINNMPGALRIRGAFSIEAIRFALQELVDRHAILRSTYSLVGDAPVLRIMHNAKVEVPVAEALNHDEDTRRQLTEHALESSAARPFDLRRDVLVRLEVLRFGHDDHALIFCMHHIASDGVSLQVLVAELAAHYGSHVRRIPVPMPALRIQYPDFARWQRAWFDSEASRTQTRFWLDALDAVPELNTLPADRPRPELPSTRGAVHRLLIDPTVAQRVDALARERQVTPFVVTLAAWQALMARYNQRDDIAVGVPTFGRSHPDLEPMIGFFINSIVIRSRWQANSTLSQILESVRQSSLQAFANSDLPLDVVMQSLPVKRALSHMPVVQVAFQLTGAQQPAMSNRLFDNLTAEMIGVDRHVANFDITVSLSHSPGHLQAEFEYNTDLYDAATIQRYSRQFGLMLEALVTTPEMPLQVVNLVHPSELFARIGINADEPVDVMPLTSMQRDMFMDTLVNPASLQSSHGFIHHLRTPVDAACWQAAIDSYSRDFALARARFVAASDPDLDAGYLAIAAHPYAMLEVETHDASSIDSGTLDQQLLAFVYRTYDLAHDPLMRFKYVRVANDHHVLAASVHHAILDGMGLEHLWRDLVRRYEAFRRNETPAAVSDRFQEHIADDRMTVDTAEVRHFWQQALAAVEPLDFTVPPPVPPAGRAVTRQLELADAHVDALKGYCRKHKITPAIYFKGLYALAIHLHCRPEGDFILQETLSGRPASHADQAGCYIQEVPFVLARALFNPAAGIDALWEHARHFQKSSKDFRRISLGLQHQLAPRGRTAFMYNYYQFVPASYQFEDEVLLSPEAISSDPANNVQFIVKGVGGKQTLNLYYHPHLFADIGFLELIEHLSRQICQQGVATMGALSWLAADSDAIASLSRWNHTARDYDLGDTLHARFLRHAASMPEAIAITDDHGALTYRQLDEASNRWARHLSANAVNPGDFVGVCLPRSCDFLVAVLAILKTGAAYVPMDANYPPERILYMRENSGAALVITHSGLRAKLGESDRFRALCVDTESLDSLSVDAVPECATPRSVAYMLYTSGSTGLPKGALIRHDGALNHIEAERDVLEFPGAFNFLQTAPASSDISVWQFLGPVCCGGTVVVLDDVTNAPKMFDLINRHHVNLVELVPVAWQLLIDHVTSLGAQASAMPSLRWLMATGEAVPVPMVNAWLSLYPQVPVINAYGPTEAADDVIQNTIRQPLPTEVRSVPIGKPLGNLNVFIVDDNMRLVPPGIPGEICISGIGVGNGYWQNPEKTEAVFVPNPFPDSLGDTIYRTGDLGRWLADGTVEYLDRVDNQVKIRGFRIELGEVEAVLASLDGVSEAAVIVRQDLPGGPALVGYVVVADGHTADTLAWRQAMRARLPDYMVPTLIVTLAAFPTTPAGKIDRKHLPAPEFEDTRHYVAPEGDVESRIADIFAAVLGQSRVSADLAFFDLGGNSLMAVRLVTRINQTFGSTLSVADLMRHASVQALAIHLQQSPASSAGACSMLLRAGPGSHVRVMVHPVGGDVLCYRELAAGFSTDIPVIGLRNPAVDDLAQLPANAAAMISTYADELQRLGHHSVDLVGQSLGGILAAALAVELPARGITVRSLTMIDTFRPDRMEIRPAQLLPAALGLHLPEPLMASLDFSGDTWIDTLYALARAAGLIPSDLDVQQIKRIYRVARFNEESVQSLDIAVTGHIPVLHVRARDNAADSRASWGTGEGMHQVEHEGDHESVMRGDNARSLAAVIEAFQTGIH